jgi:hypothetical protein
MYTFTNQATQNKNTHKPTQMPLAKKAVTPILPTEKERQLLKYTLEMKFISLGQAQRKFLSQDKDIRLNELLKEGFLKCSDEAIGEASLLVTTQKTYDLLKAEAPDKGLALPVKRIFQPAVNHDLKLVELRMRFEGLNFIEKWFSEQMLEAVPLMKRTFQDLPDAVCRKKNQKSYFLELEISKKGPKAYEERISEYAKVLELPEILEAGIEGVIFLCTNPEVEELIRSKLPKSKTMSALPYDRYFKDVKK